MEPRKTPEYTLDVFADPQSVTSVIKGILQTIFFHRFFPSLFPHTTEVLDLSLPCVSDVELETLIDQKANSLLRQLDTDDSGRGGMGMRNNGGGARGQVVVQFFEKRRRKAWFTKGEDTACWEQWTLDVTLANPRSDAERAKARRAMEKTLLKTAMKIVTIVNREKDHIPPITVSETNPFPYTIVVNPKGNGGWAGGWA